MKSGKDYSKMASKSKEKNNSALGCTIEEANPSDADDIYDLNMGAFGEKYIRYTIFQARESIHYLRALIADGVEKSKHVFYVLRKDNHIIGYYDAVHLDNEMFLNYVAITEQYRNCGLGTFLLGHFEESGRSYGCTRLGLDLFESNSGAREWYFKNGFITEKESFLVCLKMAATSRINSNLKYQNEDLGMALSREKIRGFSKLECRCGPGRITLGFINSRICKILSFEQIGLEEAVDAINHEFGRDREFLVIGNLSSVPASWSNVAVEKILKLGKTLLIQ
jgi:ribosomal protein S18 acetylase RimI-like enzyme